MLEGWLKGKKPELGNKHWAIFAVQAVLRAVGDVAIPQLESARSKTTLQQALKEYKSQPHTPELITKIFHTIWQVRQEKLKKSGQDLQLSLSDCPFTQEEIKKLEEQNKRVGYLPPELASQEKRYLLGIIWPEMESHSVQKENSVTNDESPSGWFHYDAAINAPYTNTTEDQLKQEAVNQGLEGLSLNQYIIGGQDSKLFTGKYLDQEKTLVRLLRSRRGGDVVGARFYGGGDLDVRSYLGPRNHYGDLGGRLAGVPKNA